MTTHVTTQNPVRSDVAEAAAGPARHPPYASRGWAFAGIGAGLAGIGTIVTSRMVDVVYDKDFAGTRRRRRDARRTRPACCSPSTPSPRSARS